MDMRIKSLSLRNIRLFGDNPQTVSFDADKNIVILLGNNGSGKSTILDAASILLSSYVGSFPGNTAKSFKDSDVHILNDNQVAPYLYVSMDLELENGEVCKVSRTRKGWEKSPLSEVKELKAYAEGVQLDILTNKAKVNIPILAYYGTGRGQIKAPERKRGFQTVLRNGIVIITLLMLLPILSDSLHGMI